MSRLSRIESCASCALASSPRLAAPLNLFAYTFCKITLCGLHPTSPSPPRRPSVVPQQHAALHFSPRLLSLPRGKLPSKFHPRSLMYAELYGRNSKFGMAVLGAFTMSFHPLVLSLPRSRGKGRGSLDKTRPLHKRRTRVILIRTRPRGAEVKASFLLGVPTKAPSAFARAYTLAYKRGALSK